MPKETFLWGRGEKTTPKKKKRNQHPHPPPHHPHKKKKERERNKRVKRGGGGGGGGQNKLVADNDVMEGVAQGDISGWERRQSEAM